MGLARANGRGVRPRPERASDLSTLVVVPTYNEADNLPALAEQILSLPQSVSLIVVDDASPDGTGKIADQLAAEHTGRLIPIHRKGKLGLGSAYVAGFKLALERGAGEVITMDADFSHHPRYIPDMMDKAATFSLVIGSRYAPGGRTEGAPFYRRMLSRGANGFARAMLGLKARDATAGFRLYRREVLESIPLDSIFSSGYSFLIEMLYLVQIRGWRVGETPIVFHDRFAGKSKISQAEIVRALYTVSRLAFRRSRAWLSPANALKPIQNKSGTADEHR